MRSRTIATVIVLPIVLSVLLTWGIVRSDATMIASGAASLAATIGLGWFSLRRGRHGVCPLAWWQSRGGVELLVGDEGSSRDLPNRPRNRDPR